MLKLVVDVARWKDRKALLTLLAPVLLAGCAGVQPNPMSAIEIRQQVAADKSAASAEVPPLEAELTLDEALARALKYNLERRTRLMEEALALRQLDAAQLDMLPRLLAQAGYSSRDNDRLTLSQPTPSQDRRHTLFDLGLTWSLLDFGVGYSNSVQQADRLMVAGEKRRKAMHLLMQDVRIAFWRAASAQKLRDEVRSVTALAETALEDSKKIEAQRIRNPMEAVRYQRQVLENLRLLEAIEQELSVAQIDLAVLINAPIGVPIKVAEPEVGLDDQVLSVPLEFMEEVAMTGNADLREQQYNARIAREEVRKTMLRMFPNLTFNVGGKYDTDSYLLNRGWNEAGLQLSFNVFNIFTAPIQKRMAEAGVAVADQRRVATQMAVVAQVHIAREQLANAITQYRRAESISMADNRINELSVMRQSVQIQSKLESVTNQTSAILSLLRRYQALSQVQVAQARLQATVGMEPKIDSVSDLQLKELTLQLSQSDSLLSAYRERESALRILAEAQEKTAEEARLKAEAEVQAKEKGLSSEGSTLPFPASSRPNVKQ